MQPVPRNVSEGVSFVSSAPELLRTRPKLDSHSTCARLEVHDTVERAERYDADHELVVAMQHRPLGDLPSLSGIETAARYLPPLRPTED